MPPALGSLHPTQAEGFAHRWDTGTVRTPQDVEMKVTPRLRMGNEGDLLLCWPGTSGKAPSRCLPCSPGTLRVLLDVVRRALADKGGCCVLSSLLGLSACRAASTNRGSPLGSRFPSSLPGAATSGAPGLHRASAAPDECLGRGEAAGLGLGARSWAEPAGLDGTGGLGALGPQGAVRAAVPVWVWRQLCRRGENRSRERCPSVLLLPAAAWARIASPSPGKHGQAAR